MIVVDCVLNSSDELNDGFGVVISWSSFSTDHDDLWNKFGSSLVNWSFQNKKISVDNLKDVHKLSLILVNSLDLNIIHGINWNIIASVLLHPFS